MQIQECDNIVETLLDYITYVVGKAWQKSLFINTDLNAAIAWSLNNIHIRITQHSISVLQSIWFAEMSMLLSHFALSRIIIRLSNQI